MNWSGFLFLLLFFCSIMACLELFGVVNHDGKFYVRTSPQCANPDWLGTAKEIGTDGWNDFEHLFFHPDGTLYVLRMTSSTRSRLLKAPRLESGSTKPPLSEMWDGGASSSFSLILTVYCMVFATVSCIRGSRLDSQGLTLTGLV